MDGANERGAKREAMRLESKMGGYGWTGLGHQAITHLLVPGMDQ